MLRLLLPLLLILAATGVLSEKRKFVQCPQLHGDSVCPAAAEATADFSYNDGCNRVLCMRSGKWATVTRRSCLTAETPEEIEACSKLASAVLKRRSLRGKGKIESNEGSRSGGKRRRRSDDQEYACPALAATAICQRQTNGFSYSDGCNAIKCHQDGSVSTMKHCPAPDDAAGEAYCANAEQKMLAKKQQSSIHRRCLEAETVCQGPNLRQKNFYDGCNECRCIGEGEAACTRNSCPQVLMTSEEFAAYCTERGADSEEN